MPQFKSQLRGFKIDKSWSLEFQRDMERLVRNAAREWIRAVIMKVPVWSGMARGSIKFAQGPNGSLSRFLNVMVPINPVGPRHGSFKSPITGKSVHLDKSKTPEAGGQLAQYRFIFTRKTFSFQFTSQVPHFMHNEFFARTDPGAAGQQIIAPWNSMTAGKEAFRDYLRQEINAGRFARLQKFIHRVELNESSLGIDSSLQETVTR